MIIIPYETIERMFRSYIADNFNEICAALLLIGFISAVLLRKKSFNSRKKHNKTPSQEPKWYPTGWYFNEKTKLWEPPDYINEDTADIENQKLRLERYREYRRSQGKEPTYEEWKAAREAEQRSDAESSN